jgi:predicted dehydrogenase
MKKQFKALPKKNYGKQDDKHVGLLGCGNYAYSNIAYYLKKNYGSVIRGVMDINEHRAASLCQDYCANYYTTVPEDIIEDDAIDLVYIASNHATHAEYAIEALKRGKNVHIEKPHVVSLDQLQRLVKAAEESSGKIMSVGYNRPWSDIGVTIKNYLAKEHGAAMLNWFVAGHELDPDHWYFKEEEGGRILGNLCHWTDFTFNMIDAEHRYPITIIPARSQKSDCDIAVSYIFGDGSIAAITFSAKGHTFEGVREKLAAHRGNVLVSMDDFQKLVIEVVDKKIKKHPIFRDHGHEKSICGSYQAHKDQVDGQNLKYVYETAELFLKTRDALEKNQTVIIN